MRSSIVLRSCKSWLISALAASRVSRYGLCAMSRPTEDSVSPSFTKVKNNISDTCETDEVSWNQLLREAKAQLAESKLRSAKPRAAIKYFESQEKAGEPFPGQK